MLLLCLFAVQLFIVFLFVDVCKQEFLLLQIPVFVLFQHKCNIISIVIVIIIKGVQRESAHFPSTHVHYIINNTKRRLRAFIQQNIHINIRKTYEIHPELQDLSLQCFTSFPKRARFC